MNRKVLTNHQKNKFKRKLKFYPDEIIMDYASTSASSATLPFSLIALSGRTLKSIKTQAIGNYWFLVKRNFKKLSNLDIFNQDKYKKSTQKKAD